MEEHTNYSEEIERVLDEADAQAANDPTRLSHEEVFENVRRRLREMGQK